MMDSETMPHVARGRSDPTETFGFETVAVDAAAVTVARHTHWGRLLREILGSGVALEMVVIPGGTFMMGSPVGQGYVDEHPQHEVTITGFCLGRYAVTQEQWQAVMDWLPPCRCPGPKRPVDRVSWDDAQAFCRWLAAKTGRPYRLPSEAEWEYACRAGTSTPFAYGEGISSELANYNGEHRYRDEPPGVYRHETLPVGGFLPNAFGLYEMHGGVWEWCADRWHPDYVGAPADGQPWEDSGTNARVVRGGSWHEPPDLCRSAVRLKFRPTETDDTVGFRVALSGVGV